MFESFFLEILFFCLIIERKWSVPARPGTINSPPVNGGATRGGGFDEA
jgi:hypothetical protein